ncbi:MAG: hypothetical protein SF187_04540 [Deltaproteobacteria bacterium]|nr:hypothetical protein [Deltaproteobacteria bacterium]
MPMPIARGDAPADGAVDLMIAGDAGADAALHEDGVVVIVDALSEAADAAVPPDKVVQSCLAADYVDRTQVVADRVLAWSHGFSDDERCLVVRVGQTVVWQGSLSTHPLDAEGGDSPNPIVSHSDGVVTFRSPGTFGYVCGAAHAGMYGAIHVVP